MLADWLPAIVIGFASGVLSGAFGIGGGIITTPAMTLLLGTAPLIAVGTPLPVILPSAITGAAAYAKRGLVDWRSGILLGVIGSATSVAGALLAQRAGGPVVLLGTAVLIGYAAVDTLLQVVRPPGPKLLAPELQAAEEADAAKAYEVAPTAAAPATPTVPPLKPVPLVTIGLMTGLYSGFFGLGGGFILVPMLTRWGRFPLKRAIATSLVAVALLAIPGTITHAILGHIDWALTVALIIGVVPGAAIGARLTLGSSERALRIGFAMLLFAVGGLLAAQQLGVL